MKCVALFAASLAAAFYSVADTSSPENFSPDLTTNTPILWQAPTNHLPKRFWVYKTLSPHIFPATVISNAIVLASFQSKGFPKPDTNDICITDDPDCDCPCMRVCNFYISPALGVLSFASPGQNTLTKHLPSDQAIMKWAWNDAALLGIDPAQVAQKCFTSHFNLDTNDDKLTNQICGRRIFLSRQLDGILFMGTGDDGWNEGFWIEFGSYAQINSFSLNWPDLERDESHPTANPEQIVACIRARKIIVLPKADEKTYFERVKALANAKKLTITKITPYYGEGVYGETPDNEPPKWVTPFAELEAIADFGNSNANVRIFSPILSSDVIRVLRK